MDLSALENCSDAMLESMGLTKVGDRLALRGFCNQTSDAHSKNTTRKRGLLEAFLNIRKKQKSSSSKSSKKDINHVVVIPKKEKKEKIKTKRIQLGWLHFDEKRQKFVSVRLIKGGGTRDVDIPITHTRDDILKLGLHLFFPNGFSEFAGDTSELDFRLANFKNEKIENTLHVGNTEVPFTVMNYIRAYQTNKIRLYLTSSLKEKEISTPEDGEKEFSTPEDEENEISTPEDNDEYPALFSMEDELNEEKNEYVDLSAQRLQLIEQQNLAYEHSLKCDRAKCEALHKEVQDIERKNILQLERLLRVPIEPKPENDPCVNVKVRHVVLGLLTRRFPPTVLMESVYDWIGSQSPDPEFFALCLPCSGPPLSAKDPVTSADRQTLSMVETNLNDPGASTSSDETQYSSSIQEVTIGNGIPMPSPVLIEDLQSLEDPVIINFDGEIETNTNADVSRNDDMYSIMTLSDTLNNDSLSSGPSADGQPSVDPVDPTPVTPPNTRGFYSTHNKRTLRIRRARVMHDLIDAFSKEDIMVCEIKVVMVDLRGKDEMGLDLNGIYRDAIGCFWQEFYNTCTIGERERVPALRHDFQLSEWTAISRILIKGFWDLGYFPVMLSEAFLVGIIFGESQIAEEILIQSFIRYLAQDEEEVVRKALSGSDIGKDFVNLLDRFECRKLPTTENAKSLIFEIAHKEIVQKARYVADCWKGVLQAGFLDSKLSSVEGLHKLFDDLQPTNKKVLDMISHDKTGLSGGEQDTIKYLERFVRGMELTQLKSFMMFVTGADVICVESIKVSFTRLSGLERRPIAHTCGSVLELPSTYDSYTEFRAEFSNVLAKEKWQNDIM